jgi:diaminopimelate epimerase
MDIKFYKLCASGNDFILVDNRKNVIKDASSFARAVCPRCSAIGADGVLLVEDSKKSDVKMRIINADGSEPEMCGNGARCFALFANRNLGFPKSFTIETIAGEIKAEVNGDLIKVKLTDPFDIKDEETLRIGPDEISYFFINTSVPHVVVFVEDLNGFSIREQGSKIRYHEKFKPQGTNANFVRNLGVNDISIRTYERGVEDETLACGTGSTASAIVSAMRKGCKPPVNVKTRGGETLRVYFDIDGKKVNNVYLEGKASLVYEGTFSY